MNKKDSLQNIKFAFLLNIIFSIIEMVGGLLTNSISIISDSIHDFGDAIALSISVIMEKKSRKNPNEKYTYGYIRYSVLGAFITSTILLTGSIIVIYNAIKRFIYPEVVNYNGMIIIAIFGFIINLIATLKTSNSKNINEKAINLHMLEDVLGWIAVLIGSIVMKISNFVYLDPILSLLIAVFIILNVIKNYNLIIDIFLEKTPRDIDINEIKKVIIKNKIKDIHHIHIWSMDGINNYATLHVLLESNVTIKELDDIKNDIKKSLKKFNINHTVIELELNDCKEKECNNK